MSQNRSNPSTREPPATPPAVNRATDLLREGDPHAAISVLKEAIEQSAGDWRLHDELGNALLAASRDEEAIASFMAVHRLNPTRGSAGVKIGRFYLARGLIEPALMWLRHALELDSDGTEVLATLAAAEAQSGNREQAAALLDSWVAADPENPLRRHLATAILGETTPKTAPRDYVTRLFDEYADRFDACLSRLCYCGPELIAKALEQSTPQPWRGGDILDVGCGTGLVGELLRPVARRLVGVDLSAKMLQAAADRRVYDELRRAEMNDFLSSRPSQFDAVTASDVLTYVGDLHEFCAAVQAALRPRGWIVAVLEEMTGGPTAAGYCLEPTGRFSHSERYVDECFRGCGFVIRTVSRTPMRTESGRPAPTLVVAAEQARQV